MDISCLEVLRVHSAVAISVMLLCIDVVVGCGALQMVLWYTTSGSSQCGVPYCVSYNDTSAIGLKPRCNAIAAIEVDMKEYVV